MANQWLGDIRLEKPYRRQYEGCAVNMLRRCIWIPPIPRSGRDVARTRGQIFSAHRPERREAIAGGYFVLDMWTSRRTISVEDKECVYGRPGSSPSRRTLTGQHQQERARRAYAYRPNRVDSRVTTRRILRASAIPRIRGYRECFFGMRTQIRRIRDTFGVQRGVASVA